MCDNTVIFHMYICILHMKLCAYEGKLKTIALGEINILSSKKTFNG